MMMTKTIAATDRTVIARKGRPRKSMYVKIQCVSIKNEIPGNVSGAWRFPPPLLFSSVAPRKMMKLYRKLCECSGVNSDLSYAKAIEPVNKYSLVSMTKFLRPVDLGPDFQKILGKILSFA